MNRKVVKLFLGFVSFLSLNLSFDSPYSYPGYYSVRLQIDWKWVSSFAATVTLGSESRRGITSTRDANTRYPLALQPLDASALFKICQSERQRLMQSVRRVLFLSPSLKPHTVQTTGMILAHRICDRWCGLCVCQSVKQRPAAHSRRGWMSKPTWRRTTRSCTMILEILHCNHKKAMDFGNELLWPEATCGNAHVIVGLGK